MDKPLVKVRWTDAHGSVGNAAWSLHEIPHAGIEITSYGLLLRQDEAGVSIASEVCGDDTYRGYSYIPAGMLISVEAVIPAKKIRLRQPKAPEHPSP